jgi:SAM-dependent methyltransferase
MSEMNRSFAGSMPELYDRILVPVMFEPFAQDLAERSRGVTSGHILEIAAGTGVVTRALTRVLPAEVAITATDVNPAMLKRAQSHSGLERVRWREADAVALPFGDRLFDCVLCQFGVMFFPDKRAAFREVLRVALSGPERFAPKAGWTCQRSRLSGQLLPDTTRLPSQDSAVARVNTRLSCQGCVQPKTDLPPLTPSSPLGDSRGLLAK